jgi:hypothetical protein
MTSRAPLLHLTWQGFDAAVDLIAAQCQRQGRSGVYGMAPAGRVLAVALADRLALELLDAPAPGMLLVAGCAPAEVAGIADVEAWVWVDPTPEHSCNAVMRVDGAAQVVFPWQDAPTCSPTPFVPGFHD